MKNANHLNVALAAALFALTGSMAFAAATSSGADRYARRPNATLFDIPAPEAPAVGEINQGATHDAPELSDHETDRDVKPTVDAVLPGDINGDGRVNVDDFLLLMQDWGTCNGSEKLLSDIAPQGGNCIVDVDDLMIVLENWES